jgi:hypothetical protein
MFPTEQIFNILPSRIFGLCCGNVQSRCARVSDALPFCIARMFEQIIRIQIEGGRAGLGRHLMQLLSRRQEV